MVITKLSRSYYKESKLKPIDLSIVIVNYNAKKFLNDCFSSVFNTIRRINYEVIVIDNNSSDNSVEFIKRNYHNVKLIINNNNVGYAKANNQGIKIAQGNFILLLNPDTVVFDKSIHKMVYYIKKNINIGILGCRVMNPGNKLQWDSCGKFLTPLTLFLKQSAIEKCFPYSRFLGQRLMRYWKRNSSRLIDWVSGVCMLIRRQTIENIGMLDVRFFAYMEDMDFCRRATKKNWQVYFIHDAKILHNLSISWKQRSEKHLFTSLTSESRYFEKYYGKLGMLFFKLLYLCGSYLRFFINIIANNKEKARDHYRILIWLIKNKI